MCVCVCVVSYDTVRTEERADMNSEVCVCVCVCVCTSLCANMLVSTCTLTFVVGGVVDAEISVPDDGELPWGPWKLGNIWPVKFYHINAITFNVRLN